AAEAALRRDEDAGRLAADGEYAGLERALHFQLDGAALLLRLLLVVRQRRGRQQQRRDARRESEPNHDTLLVNGTAGEPLERAADTIGAGVAAGHPPPAPDEDGQSSQDSPSARTVSAERPDFVAMRRARHLHCNETTPPRRNLPQERSRGCMNSFW